MVTYVEFCFLKGRCRSYLGGRIVNGQWILWKFSPKENCSKAIKSKAVWLRLTRTKSIKNVTKSPCQSQGKRPLMAAKMDELCGSHHPPWFAVCVHRPILRTAYSLGSTSSSGNCVVFLSIFQATDKIFQLPIYCKSNLRIRNHARVSSCEHLQL